MTHEVYGKIPYLCLLFSHILKEGSFYSFIRNICAYFFTRENIQKIAQAIASNGKTGLKKMNLGKNAMDDRGMTTVLHFGVSGYPNWGCVASLQI